MNQRTSKLLSRYAAVSRLPLRSVKRDWNATPHNKRAATRKDMKAFVEQF